MTDRLYYRDSGLLSFEGQIVLSGSLSDGRFFTVLDRSAFYPTSGGQSHDTGFLGEVPIVDVTEDENGAVRHISDRVVGQAGDSVTGTVDGTRRRRNRQLHTAQHIVSYAFYKLYGYETVSVHLGDEYGAVELAVAELPAEEVQAAEELANSIVGENVPVEIIFASEEELVNFDFRKPPKRNGTVRIIRISPYDCSGCGGTHCSSTTEVGLIHLTGTEPMRKHALVNFLTGDQVFADYRSRYAITDDLARFFTCHVTDLPDKVHRLANDLKSSQRELNAARKELLPRRAEELAGSPIRIGRFDTVCRTFEDIGGPLSTQLAGLVAERVKGIALFLVDGRLLLAVGSATELHAGNLMKKLTKITSLKGGGGPLIAQAGGAESGKLSEYRDILAELIDDV